MRILQAIPRKMRFEAEAASSVELCVAEWVAGSRYRDSTAIVAERSNQVPLLDVEVIRLAPARRLSSWHLAYSLRRQVQRVRGDMIVTQQHIYTAGRIARANPDTPVVLQTHNFIASPDPGRWARLRNWRQARALNRLAGITLISDATLARFEQEWPQVRTMRTVITNAFDFSTWRQDPKKAKLIVVVGRANDTKGILECAQALRSCLQSRKEWRAVFVLSETHLHKDYVAAVYEVLEPLPEQIEVKTNIPYAHVKEIVETAAIAIVASKWEEPFGRTALEAHAAGAALISSGTGGLRQISGEDAVYLDNVTPDDIAKALDGLLADEQLREKLAEAGARRVRRLFSSRAIDIDADGVSVCGRLDMFLDQVRANFTADREHR